ncbi:F-box protein At2g02240-like [Euphorbia lathyris]|uniref:F-box protein At2g02240-like n=1 Tax=Euphorbia lathyris TaxID=212925 RepID=UPI003313C117
MGGENGGGRNILDLAEDIVANIFSSTSPRDSCRLSTVSSKFRDLLQSDAVWNRFLPSEFQSIISKSSDSPLLNRCCSKKQLYLSLCDNPIVIEDGRKSFALEKVSGKKSYMISARDMKIAWGDTPAYWRWISNPDSRKEKRKKEAGAAKLEAWEKICLSGLHEESAEYQEQK